MQTQQETEPVIKLDQVNKRYGFVQALSDISIEIPAGVTGLLGPNGAGKTTLIKILLGVIRVTSGKVSVFGMPIGPSTTIFRNKMGYVPEDDCYLTGLTGVETVLFSAQMAGLTATEGLRRSHEMLDFCGVMQERYRAVETYSTGMRQKLALIVSLSTRAPILLLDEPTANLDPSVRGEVLNLVRQARDDGRTVIFSSHILSEIEETCDRVLILRQGRLVHDQSITDLKRQHRIRARLVGDLPEVPAALRSKLSIVHQDGKLQIETPAQLSLVMSWLSGAPLDDVYIQPISLRAVYDRFHSEWVEDEK